MSCEVIVCDARPPRRLVVGDVGRYQGAGVEAHAPHRMPSTGQKTHRQYNKWEAVFHLSLDVVQNWFQNKSVVSAAMK